MGILDWLFSGNTLYYPGCLTKKTLKQELENYKEIFNKLGIDFIMLPEELCCGSPALNAGYKKDAKELALKNQKLFKKYRIKKIVTNCPACYHTFKDIYPQLIKNWDVEVIHATEAILYGMKYNNLDFNYVKDKEIVSYHDPCHLGRYQKFYSAPRKIIELLGCKLIEMKNTKENSLCCGAGGGVKVNFPETAKKIAEIRTSQIPKEASKLITPCGLCYINLKDASEKSEEFSSFVLRKLKENKK